MEAGRVLSQLVRDTVRKHDVLVRKHAEMYLEGKNEKEKLSLSLAFVNRTLDDVAVILHEPDFRRSLAQLVSAKTESVVSRCGDGKLVAPESLTRVHSFYMFLLYLLPSTLTDQLRASETAWYRDRTVYEHYIAVKALIGGILDKIANTVFWYVAGEKSIE